MAFFSKDFKEDDKKKDKDQVAPQQVGMIGSIGPSQKAVQGKPTASGSFTNLQRYLQENKPQGERMAQEVVQKSILKPQEELQQQFKQVESGFKEQVRSKGIDLDPARREVSSILSKPQEDKTERFKQLRDFTYSGPSQFEGSGFAAPVKEGTAELAQKSEMTKSEPGRFALLKEAFKSPSYSKGKQNLDQLLIQNQPRSRDIFKQAREAIKPSTERYSALKDAMDSIAQKRQEEATKVSEFAKGQASQAVKQEEDLIKQRQQEAKQKQEAYYGSLRQGLKGGNLQEEQRQRLGLEKDQRLYGVDPAQYLQYQDDPTAAQTTTPEELARYNALLQMAETPDQGIIQEGAEFYDTGKVAGAKNLREAIQAARTTFENRVNEAEKQRAFWENVKDAGSPTMRVTDYKNVFGLKVPWGYKDVPNPDYQNAVANMNKFANLRNQLIQERESFTKV